MSYETFAAERLNIESNPDAGLDRTDIDADLLNDPDDLESYGHAFDRTRHRTILDVQIGGTDARQRHSDNDIHRL